MPECILRREFDELYERSNIKAKWDNAMITEGAAFQTRKLIRKKSCYLHTSNLAIDFIRLSNLMFTKQKGSHQHLVKE